MARQVFKNEYQRLSNGARVLNTQRLTSRQLGARRPVGGLQWFQSLWKWWTFRRVRSKSVKCVKRRRSLTSSSSAADEHICIKLGRVKVGGATHVLQEFLDRNSNITETAMESMLQNKTAPFGSTALISIPLRVVNFLSHTIQVNEMC